ncbi:hypothetical protein [Haloarcula nitratireducens]|uniref:DUF8123 domain-containing protein n=1 Tax=Haloarcula nitratireducens TaxID=2487749 RepID=A0AAW4PD94_9EURY|nr:hypothetical protein [Halomicroarcula nitratireducens]MBX0295676.1 hypothetical protein [Halomicroarcula nitratireducens]
MTTFTSGFDDPLKPIGLTAGAFLALAALGTIVGAPWATHASMASAMLQVVGAVLMIAVGALLAYLSVSDGK